MNLEVALTEEDVVAIVKAHLKENFTKVNSVTVEVGTRYVEHDPYRRDGSTYGVFKGIKCQVEM